MIINFNEFVKESADQSDIVGSWVMNNFFVICSKQEDLISLESNGKIVDMLVDDWKKLGVIDLIDEEGLAVPSTQADQIIQQQPKSRSELYKKMSVSEFMQMLNEN